jgi:predicted glycoside hydrolase/deacetylase ChbG (UPF0249 family)
MRKLLLLLTVLALQAFSPALFAQKNLAERLGYPKDAKLLIVHADDLGLSHSTDSAVIRAFEQHAITSGSIMVPCPWFPEIAAFVKKNPGLDVGIHLTLTAEWDYYKWGGVSSSDQIPGLINSNGYFYASNEELAKTATAPEVEKELRAQIEKVLAYGIKPTHLDNHMGSLLVNPELLKVYARLSNEYHLPILVPAMLVPMMPPDVAKLLGDNIVKVDNLFMMSAVLEKDSWTTTYNKAISELKPGLNEMIVHLSLDNEEMRAIAAGHPDFGSAWRQKDLDYVLSKEFKDALKKNNITLVTWKEIRDMTNQGK